MFQDIRRHQRWLWYVVSGAVIISFVWYLDPSNRGGRGGLGGLKRSVGTIYGRPISASEYQETYREAELRYFLSYGSWYGSDDFSRQNPSFMEREIRQRLFFKEKINELGIYITPAEVADWIRDSFARDKGFTEAQYDQMLKIIGQRGLNEEDLNRFVRTELGTMHLAAVAGTPGRLVTPQEAETQYRRENEQVSAQAIFFSASNYVAQVKVDPAALANFYTNQASMYRIPDKVQVAYVAFPATNYFAEADKTLGSVTNLSQRIDEMYRQRGTNFYTDTNGMVMTPDAAKAKIKDEERKGLALVEARKAATLFEEALLNFTNKTSANLDTLATQRGLKVQSTEPFSQFEGPKGMEVPEKFSQAAFLLNPNDPFIEEPVVGSDAVYVVAFKNRVPTTVPPLDTIKDRVTEDYKRQESRTLAQQAGLDFQTKLTNAVAGGKNFEAAAKDLGHAPVTLEPFNQTARSIGGADPRADISSIKNIAFALRENDTSSFTPTRDGGFILHVVKFVPVSDDALKTALPAYMTELRQTGQREAFSEWVNKEFQTAHLSLVTDKSNKNDKSAPSSDTQ